MQFVVAAGASPGGLVAEDRMKEGMKKRMKERMKENKERKMLLGRVNKKWQVRLCFPHER